MRQLLGMAFLYAFWPVTRMEKWGAAFLRTSRGVTSPTQACPGGTLRGPRRLRQRWGASG